MKQNKILLISSNRWNSAITEYLVSTAESVARVGYEIAIMFRSDCAAAKRLDKTPYTKFSLEHFQPSSALRIYKHIKDYQPNIIITFGGPETSIINYLPLGNTKRLRFRGQNFQDSLKFRLGQWFAQNRFDGTIVPSQWLREKLLPTTRKPNYHVDLGMDEEKFFFKNLDRTNITLTLVARFDPVKGHRFLLRLFAKALSLWPQHLPKPHLRLIGREENIRLPQLRQWGQELSISEHMTIETQKLPAIEDELNKTTLAIIPSLGSEVICRSAYEFLLCGCPIFVSGVGSLEETLKAPLFGQSYAGKSFDETAEWLVSCLIDAANETEETRKLRSEEARHHFSFAVMAQRLEEVFYKS